MSKFKLHEYLKSNLPSLHFIILLLVANFLWKLIIHGDESDMTVTLLGFDISPLFNNAVIDITKITADVLHFFGYDIHIAGKNYLEFHNHVGVELVWSCTPIKQSFIFTLIMLLYRGKFINRLWFIPLGLVVIYFFNIIRISAIVALIQYHPNWFNILHLYIFKYLFYAVIFGMWIFWEEKLRGKPVEKKPD